MKRLFAALKIHPDAEFLKKYQELKQELRHEHIKWVENHNIHITLKFFGETAEHEIPGIASVLKKSIASTNPVNLHLTGLGIFGSSYAPKVIWVGIEPYADLSTLMKNIHDDLKTIGFEQDRQNLVPHLTLGRIKFLRDKVIFNRTMDQFKTISSSLIHIEEVILFESILRREGPEYIALEHFPFIKKELP
ncbi:MAG: RNA 2',3'-cyclic phosphodiesterase [Bacteroidetes bacterium]|nr:RNA 2',3'-cyclic phosphodiesterase [Bacteroidota bacterium]